MPRFLPIPRTDPRSWQDGPLPTTSGLRETDFPLAGSRYAWFESVNAYAEDGTVEYPLACELNDAIRARLSDRRPGLCGLALDQPRIMGILNVTPDSFSDGGDRFTVKDAVAAARAMVDAGADILDIGGESTRPGAEDVPEAEEIRRVTPVIDALRQSGIVTPVSIDTRKAPVADAALAAGADLVNDVSAMRFDHGMAALVAERGVPVCLMHAQGSPKTMQRRPSYADVAAEVFDFLSERIAFATAHGVARDRIVADPGIGFGKTLEHNLALLRELAMLHDLGVPLLLGASRKKFIGTLGRAQEAKARMPGSLAVALHGAAQGAHILRVHDVAETRQALDLWQALLEPGPDARDEHDGQIT